MVAEHLEYSNDPVMSSCAYALTVAAHNYLLTLAIPYFSSGVNYSSLQCCTVYEGTVSAMCID